MSAVNPLDPLDFPLHGSRLIEASAGTGKTFTIALLYVRLVLGPPAAAALAQDADTEAETNAELAAEASFPPPLGPRQILVVTFTELAAGELRDRIRARLVEAARCFEDGSDEHEELLCELRKQYQPERWPHCAWRLHMASQDMDEASIATIHGWCKRMLSEHAFDTRGLFRREILTDRSELLGEVVEDYWRQHYYALDSACAAALIKRFARPQALQAKLDTLLKAGNHGVSFMGEPQTPDFAALETLLDQAQRIHARQQAAEEAARASWRADRQTIREHLILLRPGLNGTTHGSAKEDSFLALLDEIELWADGAEEHPGRLLNFATGSFVFKKGAELTTVAPLPFFDRIAELKAAREAESDPRLDAAILAHAGQWVGEEFSRRLQRSAQFGFDDLLTELAAALDPAHSGEHGERLAAQLRASFPVAMIDEFQDTDPTQYAIFKRIYEVEANRDDCGLFMIGDPKQSIYAFRGADIHTYLQARRETRGRHYTLDRNYRSTAAVVAACNHLFAFADQHPGGAFRYRDDSDDPLPFLKVDAAGRREQLWLAGEILPPLQLQYFDADEGRPTLGQKEFRNRAARLAASEITRWLASGRGGESGFGERGVERGLQPADIAVLVRSGTEAALIRTELAARNVASVYLSERASLLTTREAYDCLHWLRACAEPTDEGLVRSALGSATLQLPLARFAHWQEDELAWQEQMFNFVRLREIWQRQGVLVMLQRLQALYELPSRLMKLAEGERILTNLHHLGEWLQTAASELDGEQALIRHLFRHLGREDEQQQLRLESDAERVRILTIHKSKGLEFPLVVLPFIGGWRDFNSQGTVKHRIAGQLYTEASSRELFATAWEEAAEEERKEDLRLLYVALTRASHGLWLGIGPLAGKSNSKKPQLDKSAFGHVLSGGQAFADADAVWQALAALSANSALALCHAGEPSSAVLTPAPASALADARPLPALEGLGNWWITSYSALRFGSQTEASDGGAAPPAEPETARDEQLREADHEFAEHQFAEHELAGTEANPLTLSAGGASADFIHRFPRGPQWGTFLHGLLEWAALARGSTPATRELHGFAAAVADDAGRNRLIAQRCRLRNILPHADALSDWLKAFLQRRWSVRLPGSAESARTANFALVDLAPAQLAVELEFLFEIHHVDAVAIDQLVLSHRDGDAAARLPRASHSLLNGLLKGFIDLVIEHDGRYYVVDWKSNHLGDRAAAYTQAAMQQAIDRHRYDLQYVLYVLALHRHLRARLPDYDYARHIGGALYSFVRGWNNPDTGGLFQARPPRALIEALDALLRQNRIGEAA